MSDGSGGEGEAGANGEPRDTDPRGPLVPLAPATKASLLYGVIGGLAFLVSVQGFELLTDQRVTPGAKVGVALLIALAAAGSTYALRARVGA